MLLQGFTATYAALVATLAVIYAWLLGRWIWPLLVAGTSLWVADAGPAQRRDLQGVALARARRPRAPQGR
jgi:hypothetical protein